MTEWRKIAVNPNYEVSEDGQIRRCVGGQGGSYPGRIKKCRINRVGCAFVKLSYTGVPQHYPVHWLVAFAFLGDPPLNRDCATHKDGDLKNNHFSNLEWVTPEQYRDVLANQGSLIRGGAHSSSKLTEDNVYEIRKLLAEGREQDDIARMFNVSKGRISSIKTGAGWGWLK